jgi:quercetin dioxygenase-like cupin family protein
MTKAISFNIAATMAALPKARTPRSISAFRIASPATLGAIRILARDDSHAWERHDNGDELLILMSGHCTMTLREAGADDQVHELNAGDAILIPRGVAHSALLHTPEVQVLYLTTYEGSHVWSDGDPEPPRG